MYASPTVRVANQKFVGDLNKNQPTLKRVCGMTTNSSMVGW